MGSILDISEKRVVGGEGLAPQKGYACPRSLTFCLFLQVRLHTKLLPLKVCEEIINFFPLMISDNWVSSSEQPLCGGR